MVASLDTSLTLETESNCYPLTIIALVKSLYLVNGLSPEAVSAKTGVEKSTISHWAMVHGWAKQRKEIFNAPISPETVRGAVQAKLEAIALESSDLAQRTLALASDAITDGRTRDVMFAASAVKTFADVASRHSGNDASATPAINVSFSLEGLYRPTDTVVNVTPEKPALPAP